MIRTLCSYIVRIHYASLWRKGSACSVLKDLGVFEVPPPQPVNRGDEGEKLTNMIIKTDYLTSGARLGLGMTAFVSPSYAGYQMTCSQIFRMINLLSSQNVGSLRKTQLNGSIIVCYLRASAVDFFIVHN